MKLFKQFHFWLGSMYIVIGAIPPHTSPYIDLAIAVCGVALMVLSWFQARHKEDLLI